VFKELEKINARPQLFEFYTARDLWTDEHTSEQMLAFHLNEDIDVSSRNMEFINRSVEWIASHFNVGSGTKIADFGCGPGLYAARYEANLLNGFWSPNKYYGFLNTFKYEREKVVLDKYTVIEAARTRTIYNWLQYFSLEALEREFVAGGFTVEELYSNVAGSPFESGTKEFAVVAKKL
jgi:hypothetical protein